MAAISNAMTRAITEDPALPRNLYTDPTYLKIIQVRKSTIKTDMIVTGVP
jgi:uncharacterized protein (DUF1330 family)